MPDGSVRVGDKGRVILTFLYWYLLSLTSLNQSVQTFCPLIQSNSYFAVFGGSWLLRSSQTSAMTRCTHPFPKSVSSWQIYWMISALRYRLHFLPVMAVCHPCQTLWFTNGYGSFFAVLSALLYSYFYWSWLRHTLWSLVLCYQPLSSFVYNARGWLS